MRVPHPSRFVRRVGSPPILRKSTPVGLRQDARMTSGVLTRNLLFQSARACAYFAGAFCALAFGLGAAVCFAITSPAILL